MNLKKQEIINLSVYTQSNQHLGKVIDFEFETSSQSIVKYYIRSKDIIKDLLTPELIISSDQVISISKVKMVVEDNVVTIKEQKMTQKQAVIA